MKYRIINPLATDFNINYIFGIKLVKCCGDEKNVSEVLKTQILIKQEFLPSTLSLLPFENFRKSSFSLFFNLPSGFFNLNCFSVFNTDYTYFHFFQEEQAINFNFSLRISLKAY